MNDGVVPAKTTPWPNWPGGVSFVFGQAPLTVSTLTLSSKVQPNAYNFLEHAAREVNQVWNFCNAATYKAWHGRYGGAAKWLSAYETHELFAGCGDVFEKLGIDVAQAVASEHATRRNQFSKCKLKWRKSGGSRRSPGWIPFKSNGLRFTLLDATGKRVSLPNDPQPVIPAWPAKPKLEKGQRFRDLPKDVQDAYKQAKKDFAPIREAAEAALLAWEGRRVAAAPVIKVAFLGKSVRLFNAHRLLDAYRLAKQGVGTLRAGNFSQDAVGDWYLNVVVDKVEAQLVPLLGEDSSLGLDPGQINALTGSDGRVLRSRRYREMEPAIQQAQKRGHKKQAKRLHRKARRQRDDDQNKFDRSAVNDVARIWVGNLSPRKLKQSKLKGQAKSISDAAIGRVTAKLEAMGRRAGRVVEKVNEANSSRRCSSCWALSGPAGLDACDVRQWTCTCGAVHDRDVNAAVIQQLTGEWGWNTPSLRASLLPAAPRYWRPFAVAQLGGEAQANSLSACATGAGTR